MIDYEQFRLLIQGWASSGYLPAALAYGFVVNALLAGLLIGPVLGGLGTLVVVKRFAFFSEAVGHAALTGVAIGILLGDWRRAGMTVLWIEHDLEAVKRLADRVTGLSRRVLFDAAPAEALTPERLLGLFSTHARAVEAAQP